MTAAAFVGIALIHLMAAISPGPSFAVAVRTAAAEGFRPAAAFALGLGLGAVAWALAALLGLALLFEVAPVALTALKVAGGLFLIWIAVATWRHADAPLPEAAPDALPRSLVSGVRFGLVTQLANPKPAVFFGAVFVGLVPPGTPWPALAAAARRDPRRRDALVPRRRPRLLAGARPRGLRGGEGLGGPGVRRR